MHFIHTSVLGLLQRLNFGQLVDEISLFSNRSYALDTNRTHYVSGTFSTSSRVRFGYVHIWKEASQSESISSSIFLNGAKLMLALCLTMKNIRRSIMSPKTTFGELLVLNSPCSSPGKPALRRKKLKICQKRLTQTKVYWSSMLINPHGRQ